MRCQERRSRPEGGRRRATQCGSNLVGVAWAAERESQAATVVCATHVSHGQDFALDRAHGEGYGGGGFVLFLGLVRVGTGVGACGRALSVDGQDLDVLDDRGGNWSVVPAAFGSPFSGLTSTIRMTSTKSPGRMLPPAPIRLLTPARRRLVGRTQARRASGALAPNSLIVVLLITFVWITCSPGIRATLWSPVPRAPRCW